MVSFAFNIKPAKGEWAGTVYIRADGSIDLPDAPIITYDNMTYILTDSIIGGIVVERDNITVNGEGYVLKGGGTGGGIDLSGRINVTIKNMSITGFYCGVYLRYSLNNTITGNNITANVREGIRLDYSSSNIISENNIDDNEFDGIVLNFSSNNTITENNIKANKWYGIYLYSSSSNYIDANIMTSN
jgi:parallel beta-helix repeat protein